MKIRAILACAAAASLWAGSVYAGSGKILKTLPHFLDAQGRHSLHPSLFERDLYQANLRANPPLRAGMRFDVHWKARGLKGKALKFKLEVKGANSAPRTVEVFEKDAIAGGAWGRWTGIPISHEAFTKLGMVQAWRVSLWDGSELLAEQKSFLW